jgi:hypothetical protein
MVRTLKRSLYIVEWSEAPQKEWKSEKTHLLLPPTSSRCAALPRLLDHRFDI